LPEYVEELARYDIDHVTITINCVDPEVGARIYPWIFWKNRRVFGREAAAILIEATAAGTGDAHRAGHPGQGELGADPRRQ
jgi:nitrogen fixation protein NifB